MQLAKLKTSELQISELIFGLHYSVALQRSSVEEKGRLLVEEAIQFLDQEGLSPPPQIKIDDDGDWAVRWELKSKNGFRLDVQQEAIGTKFYKVEDLDRAIRIMTKWTNAGIKLIPISLANSLSIRTGNIFLLPDDSNNKALLLPRLVNKWSESSYHKLTTNLSEIGRFDAKISFQFEESYYAFMDLQLPSNEDSRLVYISALFRTHEDDRVQITEESMNVFLESYRRYLEEKHLPFVKNLLEGIELEYGE